MQTPRRSIPTEIKVAENKVGNDVVFVLGAGVDRVLNLPLLNTLFRDLNAFVLGPGAEVNRAIRSHVKGMRFNLQTHGGDEAESLGEKLLGTHQHLLPRIVTALDKHPDAGNVNVVTIKTILTKLEAIAGDNELDVGIMAQLTQLAGEENSRSGDTLIETHNIAFRPTVRQAMKTLFSQVSGEISDLNQDEREAFAEVITILSNFEELLAGLFTGYFTKNITDQKKYFYVAWLLWAYIRHREDAGRRDRDKSFYKTLSEVGPGAGIITFNYTDFFYGPERPRNGYFHGDCKSFIHFHKREYISNNVQIRDANTLERMRDFIKGLYVDWTTDPPEVTLPGIVPPIAMKPIICTEYLERWYECGHTIKKAGTIVIVGYSFGIADEHFNDLVRKGNPQARLIIVDPSLDAVVNRVCQLVQQDREALEPGEVAGLQCKAGGRLLFVKAKAEQINTVTLLRLLQ